jgi:hypothetical protein
MMRGRAENDTWHSNTSNTCQHYKLNRVTLITIEEMCYDVKSKYCLFLYFMLNIQICVTI